MATIKPETIRVDTSEHDDPRTAPGFAVTVEVEEFKRWPHERPFIAKPPEATPELLEDYIEAVCETMPGETRRIAMVLERAVGIGCDACKGSGVLMHDGHDLVPAPDWTGEVKPHYIGGTVVGVGEAAECPQCQPAKERPGRPSPEHVWLADGWVLL